jgi:2-oxoglutarate dehydrogenase E1 component
LANVLRKPYENIFQEFIADEYEDSIALGDVKYHLGYGNDIKTENGNTVRLNLAPNPSHLEAVGPIIQGIARAKIDHKYDGDFDKLCPILIHGDAAIAGQGVVYEVAQMVELEGYKTGGTIHLVINNQVGFTTNYLDGRSSTYCTDIGKVTKAPIFHVNGDDVEALVHTVRIAMDYREAFDTDVFIDILSYRKYGHNEGDEPRFTQPTLYKEIEKHPSPLEIYSEKLVKSGVYTKEEIAESQKTFDSILELKLEESKKIKKTKIKQFLDEDWHDYKYSEKEDFSNHIPTGVAKEKLLSIVEKLNHLPKNKKFFRKIQKLIEERKKNIADNRLDWALAELLAYGSLLLDGTPVRISGQDSIRGTFSHRHAAHTIEETDKTYTPLKYLHENQAPFNVYNSPLNEYGVLGFEYGYALAKPNGLTIWEAQFGDFVNVAQVIIDQYIASAEEKWGLMNGLVMLLPHGFEGQGPEHSSARIERFLSVTARRNMQICNITTPANFFHVLRQHMSRNFMVPLIVFTPKSLLRHPKCISTIDDLTSGSFQEVYDDENVNVKEVRRVVFCSGKIYYDLLQRKEKLKADDVALVRVEQLHPLPMDQLEEIKAKYKNALLHLWVQEEPENMGAWYYIENQLKEFELVGVTRQASGSPATGLSKIHFLQQEEIIDKVFRHCDCELLNKYCGLQCMVGKSRKEILKQHKYFLNPVT